MTIAVGLGFMEFPFSSADSYWKWVMMCEDGHIDSLWQTDRLVSEKPFLESVSTMAAIAGATKRIKFGMNVVSVGLRDPLLLAKQCATIDMLSNGRLLPGFGIGNIKAADWKASNTDTKGRGKRTNEALEIISRLWNETAINFEGDYFNYTGATIMPKPVQNQLPMWIGGSSKAAIERTANYGTGWQAGLETPEEVTPVIKAIKLALREKNRQIPEDHYGAFFPFHFGSKDNKAVQQIYSTFSKKLGIDPDTRVVVGGAKEIIQRIREFIAAGTSKFILNPIGNSDEEIFDQTSQIILQVLPLVEELNQNKKKE
ncbi:MAG: hypothetical protein CMM30_00685 [Rhodospirillaceae bacterium]|nr:hypothetical protein [Alphaproteobacteria bacterium]MBR71444.1 hypothetical protein [Rhodospirillaceae bacterium]|tara:strand:+ start:6927 stop:7868 length:942 start_codon:yes stop_codon:yes gene_type:complete